MYSEKDVPAIIKWLQSFGAPAPTFNTEEVRNQGGNWDWPELIFTNGASTYTVSIPLLLQYSGPGEPGGPEVALVGLTTAGLAHGDSSARFALPGPAPIQGPQPVDDIVGIQDPAHPGYYEPTAKSIGWMWQWLAMRFTYRTATGRTFHVEALTPGPMSVYGFKEDLPVLTAPADAPPISPGT